ncbi:28713_t:CDS:1, partial [Racocetra persica]
MDNFEKIDSNMYFPNEQLPLANVFDYNNGNYDDSGCEVFYPLYLPEYDNDIAYKMPYYEILCPEKQGEKEKVIIDTTHEETLEKENEKLRKKIEILENDIEKKDRNNDKQADYIVTLRNKLKDYGNKIDKLRMTLDNERRNFGVLQGECDRKERLIKRFQWEEHQQRPGNKKVYEGNIKFKERESNNKEVYEENTKLKEEIYFLKETISGIEEGNKRKRETDSWVSDYDHDYEINN